MRKTVVVVVFALTLALGTRAHAGATPHLRGNISITLADGSQLHLGSSLRADLNVNVDGTTTTLNEAVVEVEFNPQPDPPGTPTGFPPGPCAPIASPGAFPPGPCRFFIRGEATTGLPQPSLLLATLLLAHGYVTNDQISSTLGYTVTLTRLAGDAPTSQLSGDTAVFGMLFAQLTAVDACSAAAVSRLFSVAGIPLFPPGPCVPAPLP